MHCHYLFPLIFMSKKKAPEQTPEIQNPETEYAEIQNKVKNPEETNSGIFPPVELPPPQSVRCSARPLAAFGLIYILG